MTPINICTVVVGKTLKDFLINLQYAQQRSDFIELRVDYIQKLTISDIQTIRQSMHKQSIFTCRHKTEGGLFQGTEKERFTLLQRANDLGFDYIDIEERYYRSGMISHKQSKLILSYHNFIKTPVLSFLEHKVQQMKRKKANVCKIATYIRAENDIMKLTKLLLSISLKRKLIILGMGDKSKVSRVFFPILGSFTTYACVDKGQVSAPGQLPLSSLTKIYDSLLHL